MHRRRRHQNLLGRWLQARSNAPAESPADVSVSTNDPPSTDYSNNESPRTRSRRTMILQRQQSAEHSSKSLDSRRSRPRSNRQLYDLSQSSLEDSFSSTNDWEHPLQQSFSSRSTLEGGRLLPPTKPEEEKQQSQPSEELKVTPTRSRDENEAVFASKMDQLLTEHSQKATARAAAALHSPGFHARMDSLLQSQETRARLAFGAKQAADTACQRPLRQATPPSSPERNVLRTLSSEAARKAQERMVPQDIVLDTALLKRGRPKDADFEHSNPSLQLDDLVEDDDLSSHRDSSVVETKAKVVQQLKTTHYELSDMVQPLPSDRWQAASTSRFDEYLDAGYALAGREQMSALHLSYAGDPVFVEEEHACCGQIECDCSGGDEGGQGFAQLALPSALSPQRTMAPPPPQRPRAAVGAPILSPCMLQASGSSLIHQSTSSMEFDELYQEGCYAGRHEAVAAAEARHVSDEDWMRVAMERSLHESHSDIDSRASSSMARSIQTGTHVSSSRNSSIASSAMDDLAEREREMLELAMERSLQEMEAGATSSSSRSNRASVSSIYMDETGGLDPHTPTSPDPYSRRLNRSSRPHQRLPGHSLLPNYDDEDGADEVLLAPQYRVATTTSLFDGRQRPLYDWERELLAERGSRSHRQTRTMAGREDLYETRSYHTERTNWPRAAAPPPPSPRSLLDLGESSWSQTLPTNVSYDQYDARLLGNRSRTPSGSALEPSSWREPSQPSSNRPRAKMETESERMARMEQEMVELAMERSMQDLKVGPRPSPTRTLYST